jgi:hypothetical protein
MGKSSNPAPPPPVPAFDGAACRRFLAALLAARPTGPDGEPRGCVEVRVPGATGARGDFIDPGERYSQTYALWSDDPHRVAAQCGRLRGVSAYVTLNPVDPALLCRNRGAGGPRLAPHRDTTQDVDILCVAWLYIDIDPVRPKGISATADEHAAALALRDRILGGEPEIAAAALWGSSGNGAWILARVAPMPVGPGQQAVKAALHILAERYGKKGRDPVYVDTGTYNPSRIMCLPGTVKCKGAHDRERPWRVVG